MYFRIYTFGMAIFFLLKSVTIFLISSIVSSLILEESMENITNKLKLSRIDKKVLILIFGLSLTVQSFSQVSLLEIEEIVNFSGKDVKSVLPYGYRFDEKDGEITSWKKYSVNGSITTQKTKYGYEVYYYFQNLSTYKNLYQEIANRVIYYGDNSKNTLDVPDGSKMTFYYNGYIVELSVMQSNGIVFSYYISMKKGSLNELKAKQIKNLNSDIDNFEYESPNHNFIQLTNLKPLVKANKNQISSLIPKSFNLCYMNNNYSYWISDKYEAIIAIIEHNLYNEVQFIYKTYDDFNLFNSLYSETNYYKEKCQIISNPNDDKNTIKFSYCGDYIYEVSSIHSKYKGELSVCIAKATLNEPSKSDIFDKTVLDTFLNSQRFIFNKSNQEKPNSENQTFIILDKNPEYIDGNESLLEFVQTNSKYPDTAVNNNIEGRVRIIINIDENGNSYNFIPISKLGYGIEDEVIRVLKTLPKKFIPGKLKESNVKSSFDFITEFKLE